MSYREAHWRAQPLGQMTDVELGAQNGVHADTIRYWRKKFGIPAFGRVPAYRALSMAESADTIPSFQAAPDTQRSIKVPLRSTPEYSYPSAYECGVESASFTHRILFIPDCHIPYHDKVAWRTLLAVAQMWQPTCIIILGDFLDLYCVSSHPKKASVLLSLDDEVAAGRDCLDQLDALGVQHKYYIMGNHEARLQKYIAKHSPMFDGLLTVEGLLSLKDRGWEVTQYGDGRNVGELFVTHDMGIAGKYAVRRSMDAAWQSIVIGHVHRVEVVEQTTALGKSVKGAAFGWVGDFDAIDYMKKRTAMRQWAHGVGLCYMNDNGVAHMNGIRILNGRCRVEGTEVCADDYRP